MSCSYLNNNNETITNFEGKKLMIVSFLEGRAKQSNLSPENCKTIGIETAKMHDSQKILKLKDKMISLSIHGESF